MSFDIIQVKNFKTFMERPSLVVILCLRQWHIFQKWGVFQRSKGRGHEKFSRGQAPGPPFWLASLAPRLSPPNINFVPTGLWNLNSIIAYDFLRVSLIEAYNSTCNYDLIGAVETHLDDTIDEERLILKGYDLITNNHPSNTKRGGLGLYMKETLPKTNWTDIVTLPECVVWNFVSIGKSISLSLFKEVLARTNKNLKIL